MNIEKELDEKTREIVIKINKVIKTDHLCTELAKAGRDWSDMDLKQACEATGCLPISKGDVYYKHKLLTDPEYVAHTKVIEEYLKMISTFPSWRKKHFWDKWCKPIHLRRIEIADVIKEVVADLDFYGD